MRLRWVSGSWPLVRGSAEKYW